MSRSAVALAYDDPPIPAPTWARTGTAQIRLLGGGARYTPAQEPPASFRPITAQAVGARRAEYLRIVRAEELQAYAPVEVPGLLPVGPTVRHPGWLAVSALAVLALVGFTGSALARPEHTRTLVRFPIAGYAAASSIAAGDVPVIDTSTQPAPDAPAQAPLAPGNSDHTITGPPSISVDQIETVLHQYGSPAAGKGQALYDLGVRYGIDPAYALAFFVHESGCGTKGVARTSKSLGNIRWTPGYDSFEGYRSYSTWEAGMEDWYKLITDLYINGWNLRTVDAIIPVYAPSADNNSPPAYIGAVKSMVDSWRGR